MTPEERLRALLQADEPPPAGDGLQRIQQRLASRRSLRTRLVPALALAGVVAVAGAAALTVSLTGKDALAPSRPSQHRVGSPTPEPSGCAEGLCTAPKPSPAVSTASVTTSGGGTPVWPFTSDTQAADWEAHPGSRSWAADPVQVTQHLMDDYLGLPGKATRRINSDVDVAIVVVSAADRPVSQVHLERVGRDSSGPWSVTAASSDDLAVTQPSSGDEVSSPVHAAGTVSGVDQSVHLRLISDGLLAEAYAPAGNVRPWTQSLSWTRTDWSVAALAAATFNGKGDLSAVTITPVLRAGATSADEPAPGSVLVAVDAEHVVSVDTLTGKQLRQLSYPPSGVVDAAPDRGGVDGVVWVRQEGDSCTSSIIRAGLAHGPAGVTVDAKPVARSLPALSAGGRSLGWVEQPCGGGEKTVIVRGPDARFSTVATTPEAVNDLDVRDDGWAVVQLGRRVLVLPAGASTASAGRPLRAEGCALAAPAWDGQVVLAWEQCSAGGWRLGRWTTAGALMSRGGEVPGMSLPLHTGVADGQVLVSLANHRLDRLAGDALVDVPNAYRWGQADW